MNSEKSHQPRIAVVGTGIAGLSAAWLLRDKYDVTIFEKADRLGMGQNGINVDSPLNQSIRLDIPLRVFNSRYYPVLYSLCRHLDIPLRMLDNDSSFSDAQGQTYFRYHNWRIFNSSYSYIKPRWSSLFWTGIFLKDYFRFSRDIKSLLVKHEFEQENLGNYLTMRNFSEKFSDQFLLPFVASICTCSVHQAKDYPAKMIMELFESFLVPRPMRRWMGGTSDLENRLAKPISKIYYNSPIEDLIEHEDSIELITERQKYHFDHVILALQAHQSAELLRGSHAKKSQLLKQIPYADVPVSVHSDQSIMPKNKNDWASVNYQLDPKRNYPVASIWLNRGEDDFKSFEKPLFQSLNPPSEMKNELVRVNFKRSLVTSNSYKVVGNLIDQQSRLEIARPNIFLCGAYMEKKVPLLENGLISALKISKQLGANIPEKISLAFDDSYKV